MEIRLLVLHRKEDYPGQYLPEVVSVCDWGTLDENPQWWEDEKRKQKEQYADGTVNAWAEVYVDLNETVLMRALYPSNKVQVDGMGPVSE